MDVVSVLLLAKTHPVEDKTDWDRLRTMTDEEVIASAMSDPDAQPMTAEQLQTARRVPRTKTLRRALSLTQEEFAARYRIPLAVCGIGNKDAVSLTNRRRSTCLDEQPFVTETGFVNDC